MQNSTPHGSTSASRRHIAVWDPTDRDTGRFIVGGGTTGDTVRLYQTDLGTKRKGKRPILCKPILVKTDLPQTRCLAWSTASSMDLVAAGTSGGKALLFAMPHVNQMPSSAVPLIDSLDQIELGARISRPCLAIDFDPSGRLIALGLEKARDFGLQVFDIERHAAPFAPLNEHVPKSSPGSKQLQQNVESNRRPTFLRNITESSSRSSSNEQLHTPLGPLTTPSNQPLRSDTGTAICQTASSESINALSFSPFSACTVLCGASGKSVRLYDLRSPGAMQSSNQGLAPVMQWGTRSIIGLEIDPFCQNRFTSWGDDGAVRIWDVRNPKESLIMFSEEQAGTKMRSLATTPSSLRTKGKTTSTLPASTSASVVHGAVWDRTHVGVLAVLGGDGLRLRLWNIINNQITNTNQLLDGPLSARTHFSSETMKSAPGCTLFSDVLASPFTRPPQTVVSTRLSSLYQDSNEVPQRYLGVSKDGQFEFIEHRQSGSAAWGARGDSAFSGGAGICLKPTPSARAYFKSNDMSSLRSPAVLTPSLTTRGRASSISQGQVVFPRQSSQDATVPFHSGLSGEVTPRSGTSTSNRPVLRPRNSSHRSLRSVDESDQVSDSFPGTGMVMGSRQVRLRLPGDSAEEVRGGSSVIEHDISQIMYQRVVANYGPDFFRNEQLTLSDEPTSDFWAWIAHADSLSQNGQAIVGEYDFSFQGVLPILRGFLPVGTPSQSSLQSKSGRFPSPSSPSSSTYFDDIKHSLRRGTSEKPKDQFSVATSTLLHRHSFSPFTISSNFKNQRQLALAMCGPDYGNEDVEVTVRKFEKLGQFGKACAVAFFSGNTKRAIKSLQSSDDTRLRLLAPILATSLTMRSQDQARDKLFDEVCRQVASDGHADPLIRAMLSYVGTGDWREVLDEGALPIRDRVAVAIRFLSDEELMKWIENLAADSIHSGDLDGVVITGLVSPDGIDLLQRHVDKSGDVQTVALAVSTVLSPFRCIDFRGERWISSYRTLLNRWKLFTHRAKFDVARGKRMRQVKLQLEPLIDSTTTTTVVSQQNDLLPKTVKGMEDRQCLVAFAPPQVWIKCQTCNEPVSGHSNETIPAKRAIRTTMCPHCNKTLPKCSICLLPLGVGDPRQIAWSWCHRCRHTAHTEHLSQWRQRGNETCPIVDCDCPCWSNIRHTT